MMSATVFWLPVASGQTNTVPLVPHDLFVLSPFAPALPAPAATSIPPSSPTPSVRAASTNEAARAAITFQTGLEEDFSSAPPYLQKRLMWVTESWGPPVRAIEQGGFYGQVLRLFPSPAFIQHHGVVVSGGIVTAIKRKNPLGLIDLIILDISF